MPPTPACLTYELTSLFFSLSIHSLDWTYGNPVNLNLDEFEECRGARRVNAEMRMPAYVRQCLLIEEWNTPLSSITPCSMNIAFTLVAMQMLDNGSKPDPITAENAAA